MPFLSKDNKIFGNLSARVSAIDPLLQKIENLTNKRDLKIRSSVSLADKFKSTTFMTNLIEEDYFPKNFQKKDNKTSLFFSKKPKLLHKNSSFISFQRMKSFREHSDSAEFFKNETKMKIARKIVIFKPDKNLIKKTFEKLSDPTLKKKDNIFNVFAKIIK
jgi:hypothetical protein